jgi:kynurenine formamidase
VDRLEFSTHGRRWLANLTAPIDLAITLDFAGSQPSFFATSPASSQPLRIGTFTGSVAHGASCNCAVYTLAPHCHGTHTECVGHVTSDGTHVAALTPVAPCLALVVSVEPVRLSDVALPHPTPNDPSDRCISREVLATAASRWLREPWQALVVRTLPNSPDKRFRSYNEGPSPAPYFLREAMQWIVERDVASLVVDLPSLDRADDGGQLAAHRTFWGLAPGAVNAQQARRGRALVTELAFVPSAAPDGVYLLDLQVPAFAGDAAPSRPVLYPLSERHETSAP